MKARNTNPVRDLRWRLPHGMAYVGLLVMVWLSCSVSFAVPTRSGTQDYDVALLRLTQGRGGEVHVQTGDVNATQTLRLRARGTDGKPLSGLHVKPVVVLEPEGLTKHMEISPATTVTDDLGEFQVDIGFGDKPGHYLVLMFEDPPPPNGPEFMRFDFIAQDRDWPTMLILGLAGGLAIFLIGLKMASDGMQTWAGGRLRTALGELTRNPVVGLLLGIGVTLITQSSGATTLMLMGFVRAKLLSFRNSLAVVLGAAIGGTITVQLISFNLSAYALPAVAIGFAMQIASKKPKTQAIGTAALGFGLLFFGMKIMSDQMAPLKAFPFFKDMISALGNHPGWSVILSAVFTAGAQSSGAVLGIVLSLAWQDLVTLNDAIPIFFGASIGICFTAFYGSVGAPVEAKRVAWANLIYKVIGVLVFLPFIDQLAWLGREITRLTSHAHPSQTYFLVRSIANTYTIFMTLTGLAALPLIPLLDRAARRVLPDVPDYASGETRSKYLDTQVLDNPSVALGSALREISRMGRFVEEMMKQIIVAFSEGDPKLLEFIRQRDNKVDRLLSDITTYLTNLTKRADNEADTKKAFDLLYIVSDLESIGDIVDKNLVPLAEKMSVHDYHFSPEGWEDLKLLHHKVSERLSEMVIALTTSETELAQEVVNGFAILQNEGKRLHLRHLQRLQNGLRESIETSSIHLDVLNYLLRIDYLIFNICLHITGKASDPKFTETP